MVTEFLSNPEKGEGPEQYTERLKKYLQCWLELIRAKKSHKDISIMLRYVIMLCYYVN